MAERAIVAATPAAAATLRLDKFLWYVRLARTRSFAQEVAATGHLRIDRRVVDRAHAAVRVGNVLSFPLHDRVRVIRIEALPARRGSAAEARAFYTDLSPPCHVDAPAHAT
jgi:ribosome-associated heat shock protein Hsp15